MIAQHMLRTVLFSTVLGLASCAAPAPTPAPPPAELRDPTGAVFRFEPPGSLAPGSGTGVRDNTIYVPGMRFPLEDAPSYANSQVFGVGGLSGPAGAGQCDPRNYTYPWRDNFCETRSRDVLLCPPGGGHQGQDLRPATCQDEVHWALAAEDGQITGIGSFSVSLLGESGTAYRYLHLDMDDLAVTQGQSVRRGDRIGLVSDDFGGTLTTIHLHFDVRQTIILEDGRPMFTFVPPYASLVASYQALLRGED